ncbi:MAG TPA: hypothetical protein P5133_13400 [Spirochaetia bacterium]|nr:hypothetical protein [Spirochaetia bacterium]HRZ65920.1 hypothetical protein [Spirochaetia bacterium]
MRARAYAALDAIRGEFRALVAAWSAAHPYLPALQEELRAELGYEDYRVETSIVYNRALDDISKADTIRFVLVGDNPGKNEQLARNNRYLVGQSGRLAEGWFSRELGIDFRREVLILNKTPVHTPKTAELRRLLALAGPRGSDRRGRLESLLAESQCAMAGLAFRAARALGATLWISGLGELRRGGLFEAYRDALADLLAAAPRRAGVPLWAFNHFSMNQFAIELKRKAEPGKPLAEELGRIGAGNAGRIFGA